MSTYYRNRRTSNGRLAGRSTVPVLGGIDLLLNETRKTNELLRSIVKNTTPPTPPKLFRVGYVMSMRARRPDQVHSLTDTDVRMLPKRFLEDEWEDLSIPVGTIDVQLKRANGEKQQWELTKQGSQQIEKESQQEAKYRLSEKYRLSR